MGGLSIWHIMILALVAVVLFGGRGKISDLMGDFAKGIRSFRKGLADEEPPKTITSPPAGEQTPTMNKDTATH
jgi:sec-independent protein translocase protein TatA